jgi:hypothetical protein
MKRTLTSLVFILLLCVLICTGCKKKEDQTSKPSPPSKVDSQQQKQAQEEPQPQDQDIEPPPPPSGAAIPKTTGETSQRKVKKPLGKRAPSLPADTIKPGRIEPPSPQGRLTTDASTETEEIKEFEALAGPDEKMEYISEFADAHPEETVALVNKALDDEDAEVRLAAVEALVEQEATSPEAFDAVKKALTDENEDVRGSAVEACGHLNEPEAGEMLAQAVNDASEDVRTSAIQVAGDKDAPVRLKVLKAGIASRYEDVKEASVSSLVDMSSPEAVDVLIPALKDPNPEFRQTVSDALDFLIGQEFKTYDEGAKWWKVNRDRYDEELNEKE